MRLPNEAVQRERHITPTIDDILVDLNGATVFSILDLNSGYHQVELAPELRYITTFTTHVGLQRYKRLIFGISSASEKFQATLRDCLEGLDGTRNLSDDIIIFAKDQESHDIRLRNYVSRFIPDFDTITAPLRMLTHKDVEWRWGQSEEESLALLKRKLGNGKTEN